MNKWRPEGWSKIKTKVHNSLIEAKGKGHWPCFDDDYMEAGADAMLETVCEEIEKVENPYSEASKHIVHSSFHEEGFQDCRQKILTLLRSKGG